MTTKEEKARLVAIAGILRETAEELALISDVEIEKAKDFIAAKVKKEPKQETFKTKEQYIKEQDGKKPLHIADLQIGDVGILLEAEILSIERNSGNTKAGKAYEKATVLLQDETGAIKLVLWNEQIEHLQDVTVNDVVRVHAWKVEKGYKGGGPEIVFGAYGSITEIKHPIQRWTE